MKSKLITISLFLCLILSACKEEVEFQNVPPQISFLYSPIRATSVTDINGESIVYDTLMLSRVSSTSDTIQMKVSGLPIYQDQHLPFSIRLSDINYDLKTLTITPDTSCTVAFSNEASFREKFDESSDFDKGLLIFKPKTRIEDVEFVYTSKNIDVNSGLTFTLTTENPSTTVTYVPDTVTHKFNSTVLRLSIPINSLNP